MAVCIPSSDFPFLCLPCSTRSRTIRNTTSARASVPSLLYEESEPTDSARPWLWRTNLSATKPFWENWFVGLSRKFLDARGGKLLLLAGTDRLDKELMIGQMQGKALFQSFSSIRYHTDLSATPQVNINCKYSPKLAISCMKTSLRRLHRYWQIFIDGMIGVH
jgi:hypothetical protein